MKIKLFSVGTDVVHHNMIIKAKIAPTLRIFADNPPMFDEYESFEELAKPLNDAIKSYGLVMIFAAPGVFSTVKSLLISALHLKTEADEKIKQLINTSFPEIDTEDEFVKKHYYFPKNADIFEGDGGIYSGFACRSGDEYIMLLPFDTEHTVKLVKKDIVPFLSRVTGVIRPLDDMSVFNDLCMTMRHTHVTAAVADTATAEFIRRPLSATDSFSDLFKFSEKPYARGNTPPEQYVADIARNAAEEKSALFGIAISNVLESKDKIKPYYVVLCVYSSECAQTSQFKFSKTDDMCDSLSAATNELFTMLKVRIQKDIIAHTFEGVEFETF